MAYEKQTWVDNETVIKASMMQHIEDGIAQNTEDIASNAKEISENKESISANTTQIEKNTENITQKADQTDLDDLSEKVSDLNTSLADLLHDFTAVGNGSGDLNDWTDPGIYQYLTTSSATENNPGFTGYVIVFKYDAGPNNGNTGSVTQIVVGYRSLQIAVRYYAANSGTWSEWKVFE